jgi:hypothetical protein
VLHTIGKVTRSRYVIYERLIEEKNVELKKIAGGGRINKFDVFYSANFISFAVHLNRNRTTCLWVEEEDTMPQVQML